MEENKANLLKLLGFLVVFVIGLILCVKIFKGDSVLWFSLSCFIIIIFVIFNDLLPFLLKSIAKIMGLDNVEKNYLLIWEERDFFINQKKQGFIEDNYLKALYLVEENEDIVKKIEEKVGDVLLGLIAYSSIPFFMVVFIGAIYNDFINEYNGLAVSTVIYWFANVFLCGLGREVFHRRIEFPHSYNSSLGEINEKINFIYSLKKDIEAENLIKRVENVPKKYSNSKRKRIFEKINVEAKIIVDELFSQFTA